MDPELVKVAVEELGKSWAEYRKTNDERMAALESGKGVAELNAKLAKIETDVASNHKIVEDFGKLQAQVNRINLGTQEGGKPQDSETRKAFNAWARDNNGRGAFKAATSATRDDNTTGGYFVMPEVEAGIDRVAAVQSVMRQLADVRGTNAAEVKLRVGLGGAGAGWTGERDTKSQTDAPTFDEVTIPVCEMYADPKASNDLLDDAGEDLAAWLENECGEKFGDLEGAAFIGATGYTPKRVRGILAYDKVVNASYAWGKTGYIITGVSGGFSSTLPVNNILDLVYALKEKYRQNAAFVAEDTTIALVRKMKNDYGYFWQPSLVAGQPATLAGYPIYSDGNMPVVGADSYSIAFGDFKRGYAIRDRAGIQVLRDPYSTKGYVEFYTTKRVGAGIKNFEAIKLLKFGTS